MPLVLWSEAAEMDMNTTLSDITSEIDYAVANNLWLIILFHRVDETGSVLLVHQRGPLADSGDR